MPFYLRCLSGPKLGDTISFEKRTVTLGRAKNNDVAVPRDDVRASAHHAEIVSEGNRYVLRDVGSRNGTLVNGEIGTHFRLADGDVIQLGSGGPRFRFELIEREDPRLAPSPDPPWIDPSHASATVPNRPEALPSDIRLGNTTIQRLLGELSRRTPRGTMILASVLALAVIALVVALLSTIKKNPAPDFVRIADENQAAVVLIRCEYDVRDERGNTVGQIARDGSGFAVSADGIIVTNRHLLRIWEYDRELKERHLSGELKHILVVFADHGFDEAQRAEVVRLSQRPEDDVGAIRVNPSRTIPVVRRLNPDAESVHQGDAIAVIGYPHGAELLTLTKENRARTTLSLGVVSRLTPDFIQIDAAASAGSSGGPVFDAQGRVIGILTAGVGNGPTKEISFVTPIQKAMKLLDLK